MARDEPTVRRAVEPEGAVVAGYRFRTAGPAGGTAVDALRAGEVVVGRGEDADIVLGDPSISRRHARLLVGETLRVEDLGSANGTRVRAARLAPGVVAEVAPGDFLQFGDIVCTVEGPASGARPRLIRSHAWFEARIEDECALAPASNRFAIARVRAGAKGDEGMDHALLAALRPEDIVALYGPGDYEVLLPGMTHAEATGAMTIVRARLAKRAPGVDVRVASFPAAGRTAQRLLAAVRDTPAVTPAGFVVADPAMERLHAMVARVAAGTVNVLLLGETGTGKEVFASLVHAKSPRAAKPFVRLNCAAFTESLVESELFGHEKGAFSGAATAKEGLLESAAGGTVFLDEVGELPAAIQAKLLRVLEDREVRRVGALKPRPVDVRIVAATNRDLEAEIAAGRFRADLFYRLNGFSLVIPALRDRPAEIPLLAQRFADVAHAGGGGTGKAEIAPDVLEVLLRYAWPGNVRELRNVMERAVLLAGGDTITTEHLPVERLLAKPPAAPRRADVQPIDEGVEREGGDDVVAGVARGDIVRALEECAGNQTRAAERLGITRRQLVWRLQRFGLPRPRRT